MKVTDLRKAEQELYQRRVAAFGLEALLAPYRVTAPQARIPRQRWCLREDLSVHLETENASGE